MHKFLPIVGVLALALLGCMQNDVDLTVKPLTNSSDAAWVREFDARMAERATEIIGEHRGRLRSKRILRLRLQCRHDIAVAQVRAAETLSKRAGLRRADAIAEVRADPLWTIASQNCRDLDR